MEDKNLTARQVASRDITEYCREERQRLGLSPQDPMGPQNCLRHEIAIREYAGVEERPDFRQFNGGHNKLTTKRIYVTFYTADGDWAILCESEEQVGECKRRLGSNPKARNVRVNRCGKIKNKNVKVIPFKEFEL